MDHSIPIGKKEKRISLSKLGLSFSTFSFVSDFFLLTISYSIFYYIRHGTWIPSSNYFPVLMLIYSIWLIISLSMRKYRKERYGDFRKALILILKSTAYMTYLISFTVVFFEFFSFSRAHVFGTCVVYGIVQLNWLALLFLLRGKDLALAGAEAGHTVKPHYSFSIRRFLADLLLVMAAFYLLNYFKRGTFVLSPEYEKALLMVLGVWFVSSIYTGKFASRRYPNYIHAITPYIKAVIVSVMLMSVLVFFFRMFYFSRLQIFGTFFSLGFAEILLHFFYSDLPLKIKRQRDIETVEETKEVFRQEDNRQLIADFAETSGASDDPARDRLQHHFLKNRPGLFEFLSSSIDLEKINTADSVVLNTHTLFNIETIEDGSLTLFVNLERLNNMRRINRYLLEVHKKFYNGSYLVGCAETFNTHYKKIMSKYPKYVAEVIYAIDFLVFRVLPKIPILNKLYFAFSRGKNRVISEAEVLGRLHFCGFEVFASRAIDREFYFIARKIKQPSIDQNPSYGPFIRLRRIGYNGNIIYINKFRTMHPYSEYLQDYVYEQNRLQLNGKFNDDFRVTKWGKVFRKMWIDEIPQISNFLRGDISLVGVRALSEQYFKLYPKDLRELRTKFKPGLIPPYYADMPNSFEEIVESERQYLLSKQNKPFTTDVKYFVKAVYNILFKKARSR